MEGGSPLAWAQLNDLVDGIVLLHPRKALILTSTSQSVWELQLGLAADRDPADCVQRVRWKPSCRGGRTWVKPPVLDRDLRAARSRARPSARGASDVENPEAALLVIFRGPLSSDPEGLLKTIISKIGERTHYHFQAGDPRRILVPGTWVAVRDGSQSWTGAFRLQLEGRAAALELAVQLRSFAVRVGDTMGVFDVHSPYLPDWLSSAPPTLQAGSAGFQQQSGHGHPG